jgi:hypothetical protein
LNLNYTFSSTTAAANPGSGNVRVNNAVAASITAVFVSSTSVLGNNLDSIYSEFYSGDLLQLWERDNDRESLILNINGTPINNTGWWTIPVQYVSGPVLTNLARTDVTPIASPASRLPPGGAVDQVLGKLANEDYAVGWVNAGTGGGGTGDVVGPPSSTVGNVVAWNNTTGDLVANSTKVAADLVTNAAGATDNSIARFDLTTGKLIQGSGITITDVAFGTLSGTNTGDNAANSSSTPSTHVGTGGAQHSDVVAAGASGFMTGADKTKLNGITGTNTGNQTTSGTAPVVVATGSANPAISLSGTAAQFNATVTDADFATTTELALKANLASPVFSGTVNGLFSGSASQALANFAVVSVLPGSPLPNTIYFVTT